MHNKDTSKQKKPPPTFIFTGICLEIAARSCTRSLAVLNGIVCIVFRRFRLWGFQVTVTHQRNMTMVCVNNEILVHLLRATSLFHALWALGGCGLALVDGLFLRNLTQIDMEDTTTNKHTSTHIQTHIPTFIYLCIKNFYMCQDFASRIGSASEAWLASMGSCSSCLASAACGVYKNP